MQVLIIGEMGGWRDGKCNSLYYMLTISEPEPLCERPQ